VNRFSVQECRRGINCVLLGLGSARISARELQTETRISLQPRHLFSINRLDYFSWRGPTKITEVLSHRRARGDHMLPALRIVVDEEQLHQAGFV